MSGSAAHNEQSSVSAGSAFYTIAAITLVVALAALGAAYGLRAYFEAKMDAPADPALAAIHNITIGAQRYGVPAGLLSDMAQRRDGFAERIDLRMALPLLPGERLTEIDLTVMARGRVRTSAVLLDSVYLHQFADAQTSGAAGLVGKPLDEDAGTEGETVWYDPLSANPFVAKCAEPVVRSNRSRACVRVLTLSDRNTAIVAFDAQALHDWRDFDQQIEAAIAPLRL